MFYSLRGKLIYKSENTIAIECGGVGYKCYVTMNTISDLPNEGDEVMVFTHLNVREDAMDLFGFSGKEELNCFKMLTSVSGVGTKMGISILSTLTPNQIATAIASEDHRTLTLVPGVGNKLAQRIVLELRDKISKVSELTVGTTGGIKFGRMSSNVQNAVKALSVLGYSQSEAMNALSTLDENLKVEDLIKGALKIMSSKM